MFDMVLIPAGTFMMGSPESEEGTYDDENLHQVTITKPFYFGKYPVTQAQWQAVMGNNPSHFKGDNLPVVQVSWKYCKEFIKKLNKQTQTKNFRLPTEAEWEYACRAGSTTAYCYGDNPDRLGDYAWYVENSDFKTHQVGQKKPNAWGLYDMHGNVWEWCADYWAAKYPDGPVADPTGPKKGKYCVLRGGSYLTNSSVCCSTRYFNVPTLGFYHNGFRLARNF